VPVEVVSGRIGHAQVSTTLDIYVTIHEAQDADAAERVAGVSEGRFDHCAYRPSSRSW